MDINCVTLLFSFSLLVFLNSSLAFSNHVLVDLQANSYQDTAIKLHKSRYEITNIVMTGRRWLREMSTEKIQGMGKGSRNTDAYSKGEKPHFGLWGTLHEGNYLESRKKFESSRGQEVYQKDDKGAATRRNLKATDQTSQKRLQDVADQTFTVMGQDYVPMRHRRRSPVHN